MLENALLQYGVLGAVALVMGYMIKRLYDDNQKLNAEIRTIQQNSNDRFISIITTINEQQERIHVAIEKVVESLALQEYVAKKLDDLQRQQQDSK